MTGRVRAIVGLLVVAFVTSACAGLPSAVTARVPTAGPIQQGEQVGVDREDQFIRVIARDPRPGMSPTDVVQGFLDASASFDGDHAVARRYLTPAADAGWRTTAGVTVYDGVPALTALGDSVQVIASRAGTISAAGRYQANAPTAVVNAAFALRQVDGEWRIDDLPQGLLLSSSDVDRSFRPFSLYFFDPAFRGLVPDQRLIPVVGPGLATTLVRSLVAGPSEWLQPAVRTGFPAGVRLNIDSVPIDGGVAHVDLTANARQADDQARRAMSQQVVWTLRQVPDVHAVDITAGGQPLVVPGVSAPQSRDAYPQMDPDAVVPGVAAFAARATGVVRIAAGGLVEPVAGAAGLGEPPLSMLAVSPDARVVAGADADGSVWMGRMADTAPMIEVRPPGRTTSVAFGGTTLWVVDEVDGLAVVQADGTALPVAVGGLGKRVRLVAAVPSRDGTRAALIVRRGPRAGLLVARVVRGPASGGLTIDAPVRVETRLAEVVSVAWAGSTELAVLGAESAGALQVFDVSLGRGTLVPRGAPATPLVVAATPGRPTLVGSGDGLVYEFDAGAWVEAVRATSPAYPG